jgi:hypothetical protein
VPPVPVAALAVRVHLDTGNRARLMSLEEGTCTQSGDTYCHRHRRHDHYQEPDLALSPDPDYFDFVAPSTAAQEPNVVDIPTDSDDSDPRMEWGTHVDMDMAEEEHEQEEHGQIQGSCILVHHTLLEYYFDFALDKGEYKRAHKEWDGEKRHYNMTVQ